jgi:hypothetical protein
MRFQGSEWSVRETFFLQPALPTAPFLIAADAIPGSKRSGRAFAIEIGFSHKTNKMTAGEEYVLQLGRKFPTWR